MASVRPRYLLYDGECVDYDAARVHVLSTAFKYGAVVFEGLRAYWNPEEQQLFGFRIDDHMPRHPIHDRMSNDVHVGSRPLSRAAVQGQVVNVDGGILLI